MIYKYYVASRYNTIFFFSIKKIVFSNKKKLISSSFNSIFDYIVINNMKQIFFFVRFVYFFHFFRTQRRRETIVFENFLIDFVYTFNIICRVLSIIEKILIFLYFIVNIDIYRYISFEYDNRFENLTTFEIDIEYATTIDHICDFICYNFVFAFIHLFCDLISYRVLEISRLKFIRIFQINVLFSINLQNFY